MSKITSLFRNLARFSTEAALGATVTKGAMLTIGRGAMGTATLAAEKVFGTEVGSLAVESIIEGAAFAVGAVIYASFHPCLAHAYKTCSTSAKTAFASALLMISSPVAMNYDTQSPIMHATHTELSHSNYSVDRRPKLG